MKVVALALFAAVCVQAAPVAVSQTSLDGRSRQAKPQGLFDFVKKAAKKFLPKVLPKILPPKIGNLVSGALPVLTGSGPILSKVGNVAGQVANSGVLPSGASGLINKGVGIANGFQSGGIGGALNAATGGQGLGGLLGGGSSGGGGLLGNIGNTIGGLLGGGGSGGSSGGTAMPGAGAATGAAGSAAGAHSAVLGGSGLGGGLSAAGTGSGAGGAAAAPVPPPPVAAPVAAPVAKPLPKVAGKSSGKGSPSTPGNPAVWKGHAIDPAAVKAGTKIAAIKGGSGDATKGFNMKGRFGELKVQADGTWEYDLDESNALVKAYGDRANALFDVFTLELTGGAKAEEIRIHVWEHFKKNP